MTSSPSPSPTRSRQSTSSLELPKPVRIWGLPITPLTRTETIETVATLIDRREPTYFITANTQYAMLCHQDSSLRAINERAAFILADGAPLVWASRWRGRPLPERVAGSDLILDLSASAARRGDRVFFVGGAPGIADQAAEKLAERSPGLNVVGTACPPFRPLTPEEQRALIDQIRAAQPDLLFAAFTMPKGERWIAEHIDQLEVPVLVNVGAAIDFAAGRVRRAPIILQKTGLEWAHRIYTDPKRLGPRYARNARFLAHMGLKDLIRGPRPEADPASIRASSRSPAAKLPSAPDC